MDAHGAPVTIIGHSRSGQVAQVLAVRFPSLVNEVITVASPIADPYAMHASLRQIAADARFSLVSAYPGLVDGCPLRTCCQQYHNDLLASSGHRLTCLFSKADGIVDWRCRRSRNSPG